MENLFLANLGKNGHVDTLEIAREFYALFWRTCLENNSPDDFKGKNGCKFTGETIISFNTVNGCMIRLLPEYENGTEAVPDPTKQYERLKVIKNSNNVSKDIKDGFNEFFVIYHSLANLMPLGNGLNVPRSKINRDFPDSFLKAIKCDCYRRPKNTIDTDSIYKFKKWKEYFEKFKTWNEYVEMNYLQPFFEDNAGTAYSMFVQLAPSNDMCMPWDGKCAKCMSVTDKIHAKAYIKWFLYKAINIIKNRAALLNNRLQELEKSNIDDTLKFKKILKCHLKNIAHRN